MKKLLTGILLLSSLTSFADCGPIYKDRIKALEIRMMGPRGSVITGSTSAVLTSTVILATAGAMSAATALALPVGIVSAGAYFAELTRERNSLRKVMHVLADAHKGDGPILEKFLAKLDKRGKAEINKNEVIHFLTQNDFDNQFCVENIGKDTFKLTTYHQLMKAVEKELNK